MFAKRLWAAAAAIILSVTTVHVQQPAPSHLEIKFVRDSAEYVALTRQVFRMATSVVTVTATERARSRWAVVLDVDETSLDNSVYQLERAAYGLPYDPLSWKAWVVRSSAPAVPGVADFVAAVRAAGGHVAWITNRRADVRDATRANLQHIGLWNDDDRLCTQDTSDSSKRGRRAEVTAGTGTCGWSGKPTHIVAFVGDQLGDFPDADERIPDTGSDTAFGRTCFLLPNPMYGDWAMAAAPPPQPRQR